MEKICYIVGAMEPGEICLAPEKSAFVIAADGGLTHLRQQGVTPDLIVGDFDSLGHRPAGENIICHPVEKDDTDTMLAVKLGLQRGCRTFLLYGGMGGRPDHTIANLQTLRYLAGQGAKGYLIGEGYISCVIRNDALQFPAGMEGTISVFCMGDAARGVTERGLHYTLEKGDLTGDFPLGVSNHFVGCEAFVSVEDGSLLVMWEETAASLAKRL